AISGNRKRRANRPRPILVFSDETMAKLDERVTVRADLGAAGAEDSAVRLVRLFNELRDELVSTMVFVLGNVEDAKDAAQEAFVKCWSTCDQLHKVENLRGWIFRVA